MHLVQDKIDYWRKRENTIRQQDFDAIKTILEKAMEPPSSIDVEVSYFFNHSLRLFYNKHICIDVNL